MDIKMFLAFLADLLVRMLKPNPKFFNVLASIGVILTVITGIPELLINSGVELPEPFEVLASKFVSIIGLVIFFISQLPVVDNSDLKLK
jgi:pilus assembly protein TadC